jgi:hypothetical protein
MDILSCELMNDMEEGVEWIMALVVTQLRLVGNDNAMRLLDG